MLRVLQRSNDPVGNEILSFPSSAFLTPSIQEYHFSNCFTSKDHTNLWIAYLSYAKSLRSRSAIFGYLAL
ncbi:hypothetical protein GS511_03775 [Leptospira borgpetersenii]|nr:hypothetical protein GS524_03775 [Leptospira borgpetersenii]QHE29499.1 hypothetical protein GS523_03785 [Leptospira borgpetersenii]QHE32799.1 hypothetical protein GS517_03770 [Leptospira borgpetersenii]QHE36034.1 hypothetical protein GS510_03420 [Leptospira borgpetersenii]QHE39382.1 hypothetical protein GS527_04045 [Leptospira borgpetersenii]